MDSGAFDRLTRVFARRTSRRNAMRAAGVGAAVAALPTARAAAQDSGSGVCVLEFEAIVRLGPSAEDERDATIVGELRIPFGEGGAFDAGTLTIGDDEYPVVGQAYGRTVALRIGFGRRDVLVAVGAGEESWRACRGEYGGSAVGPERGDLGDWRAIALESIAGEVAQPTVASGGDTPAPTAAPPPTATPCVEQACADPLAWDAAACACTCSWIEPGMVACGGICCPVFSVCTDPSAGTCSCPDGTVLCGNTCVAACTGSQTLDASTCECV